MIDCILKWLEVIESTITIVAIIIGGGWGFYNFVLKRGKYPHASVSHRIIVKKLTDKKNLLHLYIDVKNIGERLLSLTEYEIRINQIIPLTNAVKEGIENNDIPFIGDCPEIDWNNLLHNPEKKLKKDAYEIEPSEKQEFNFDFVIDDDVKTIQVYSYIRNKSKPDREIGWDCTTFHDIKLEDSKND